MYLVHFASFIGIIIKYKGNIKYKNHELFTKSTVLQIKLYTGESLPVPLTG